MRLRHPSTLGRQERATFRWPPHRRTWQMDMEPHVRRFVPYVPQPGRVPQVLQTLSLGEEKEIFECFDKRFTHAVCRAAS